MEFIIADALKNVEQETTNYDDLTVGQAKIRVIGAGGAGNNMVSWLYKKGIKGAEIAAINTDKQHLDISSSDHKVLIGRDLTRGLGCGGFLDKGRDSAKESITELKELVSKSDMVFICAGMGGGTGTGSAPIIAQIAKEQGAIVIGTVTMPFSIEKARVDKAEFGLQQLRQVCDTVIVIDNNRLVNLAGNLPIKQAFAVANELVSTMIKGIVEIIAVPSLVNLDYADVKAIMSDGGVSAIGIGESGSEGKVQEAVNRALSNPLLEISYEGATGALIHITGGEDMLLDDVNKVGEMVTRSLDPDSNVIWGARIDPGMEGKIRVMTIITGVTSPYVLGKVDRLKERMQESMRMERELGIDMLK